MIGSNRRGSGGTSIVRLSVDPQRRRCCTEPAVALRHLWRLAGPRTLGPADMPLADAW
jgi:hypothetical protein